MLKTYLLLYFLTLPLPLFAAQYCAIEQNTFYCHDNERALSQQFDVHPVDIEGQRRKLQSNGVIITNPTRLLEISAEDQLTAFENPFSNLNCHEQNNGKAQIQEIFYTPNEFNVELAPHDGTLERINDLLDVMHESNICSLDFQTDEHLAINNIDDVVEHFICISNYESSFGRGRDNFGMGGRGAWGIHPDHDGNNAPCSHLSPIARHSNGREITKNENPNVYDTRQMRLENFKCALVLYNTPGPNTGFRSWGQRLESAPWGSNQKCLPHKRARFDFRKLIGRKMCCTDACKSEFDQEL